MKISEVSFNVVNLHQVFFFRDMHYKKVSENYAVQIDEDMLAREYHFVTSDFVFIASR